MPRLVRGIFMEGLNSNKTTLFVPHNLNILVHMKMYGFVILAAMLFMNAIILPAWANPCISSDEAHMQDQAEMSMDHADMVQSNMPCEDTRQNNNDQHCDGVCLCSHMSTHQLPILPPLLNVDSPALSSIKHQIIDDHFIQILTSIPKRPPRA